MYTHTHTHTHTNIDVCNVVGYDFFPITLRIYDRLRSKTHKGLTEAFDRTYSIYLQWTLHTLRLTAGHMTVCVRVVHCLAACIPIFFSSKRLNASASMWRRCLLYIMRGYVCVYYRCTYFSDSY
uniref:Uncharacterized protein n=1 Tax=Sipha flava TaxID=143950 RepID=A0A2S2R7H8_9HEMI